MAEVPPIDIYTDMPSLVRTLIERRSQRGRLVYGCLAATYSIVLLAFGQNAADLGPVRYLPVLLFLAQAFYPTLLGWLLIAVPVGVFAVFAVAFTGLNLAQRAADSGGQLAELLVVAMLLVICGGLYRSRPIHH
jgi:peptidoglycan/LPS O-acetylase OafA/YrhL